MAVLRSAVRLQQACVRQVTFSFMVDAEVGCATNAQHRPAVASAQQDFDIRYYRDTAGFWSRCVCF